MKFNTFKIIWKFSLIYDFTKSERKFKSKSVKSMGGMIQWNLELLFLGSQKGWAPPDKFLNMPLKSYLNEWTFLWNPTLMSGRISEMLALPQKVGVGIGLCIFTSVNWSLLLLLEFSLIMWSFRSRSTCFLPRFKELLDLRSVDDPFLDLPRPFLGLGFLGEILIKVSKAVSILGFSCCWKKINQFFT